MFQTSSGKPTNHSSHYPNINTFK